MNIIIISGTIYPENSPRSFRTTELVKEFCQQGHNVTYVGRYNEEQHQALVRELGFTFLDVGPKTWYPIPTFNNKLGAFFSKVANKVLNLGLEYPDVQWAFQVRRLLKKLRGFDLMISIAVPHPIHWGVAWAMNGQHKIAQTWVADCGDSYYLNKLINYRPPFYFKYIESFWCRRCDFISNPMDAMKDNFLPEFRSKCIEIPQGFKIEDSQKFLKPYTQNSVPTFAFSGSFIPYNRDPRPLFEYLIQLDTDFRFHIFNRQAQFTDPYISKAKGRFIIHDYISRPDLLAFQSQMDFLVNFTFDPIHQVPSKLIDYLITGKPILNIEPELDVKNVKAFLDSDYSRRFTDIDIDRYRIEGVCAKFISLVK